MFDRKLVKMPAKNDDILRWGWCNVRKCTNCCLNGKRVLVPSIFPFYLKKTDQLAQILKIKLGEGNMTEAFRQQQLAKICVITQCSESR